MTNKEENKVVPKVNINCLTTIYATPLENPYK